MTITFLCREPGPAPGKDFAGCPTKSSRQRLLCRVVFCRRLFAGCCTRQRLCRVFLVFCCVLFAPGKAPKSCSAWRPQQQRGSMATNRTAPGPAAPMLLESLRGGRSCSSLDRSTQADSTCRSLGLAASAMSHTTRPLPNQSQHRNLSPTGMVMSGPDNNPISSTPSS